MSQRGITGRSLAAFRMRLLAWYAQHKRAMPWRGTRNAYRVWVSEVMLQQTRVAAVEPYYRRFVRRFPTLRALARARSEEVLKLWAGLGYYSRARNLHRAAKEMVAKHGGKFPREAEAALALPGVGRYTAAAVLSIAYGEALAVVDGNVARVVARLGAVRGNLKEAGRWKRLEERAQELMTAEKTKNEKRKTKNGKTTDDARRDLRAGRRHSRAALHTAAGEWNQAMMELGATVCTPRVPRCAACPVAPWCRARKMGQVEKIPAARKKRETERVELAAAVFLDGFGYTLLVNPGRADADGYFSGLWQFPAVEVRKNAKAELHRHLKESLQFHAEKLVPLPAARHSVTYREIKLRPFLILTGRLPRKKAARSAPLSWVGRLAVSSATKKIARAAMGAVQARSMSA
jgi:A/G-specific adenine glycosylase